MVPPHEARFVDAMVVVVEHRKPSLGRAEHVAAAGAEPDWERHAEEALARDAPVPLQALDPVAVALAHVLGEPADARAELDELVLLVEHLHEPLARRQELDLAARALEDLDDVLECLLGHEVPSLLEAREDRAAGLLGEQAFFGARERRHAPVAGDRLAQLQTVLLEPLHVGLVAERATHHHAGALLRVHLVVGADEHLVAEQRHAGLLTDQLLGPCVARVHEHRDAGAEQLGSRRGDLDRAAVHEVEPQAVHGGLLRLVVELGLGHGGLRLGVPQGGARLEIGLVLVEQVEEAPLADADATLVDGAVAQRPVSRDAEAPPERLELGLVAGRGLTAETDELLARQLAPEHAMLLLGKALGRQAVVVEAERVEDVAAPHALEADDALGLRVREHVAHVERPRDGGGRRVDAEDLARCLRVEAVDALALPELLGEGVDRRGFVGLVEHRIFLGGHPTRRPPGAEPGASPPGPAEAVASVPAARA